MLRSLKNLDLILLSLVVAQIGIGLVLVYSAAANEPGGLFARQCVWAVIAAAAMVLTLALDYRRLAEYAPRIYAAAIAMLVYVLFFGHTVSGASRWIRFGAVGLQPSEVAKLAVILVLARMLSPRFGRIRSLTEIGPAAAWGALPMLLILRQPDLGTAMVLVPVLLSMFWMAGAPPRRLAVVTAGFLASLPLAWFFLHDYQRDRVLAFANPAYDPLAAGWSGIQAKIAVGSGGLLGKGFLAGTQGQLQFVPQHHTDFIFAVLAEEWGFLGSVLVMTIYLLLILQAMKIARQARDDVGTLLATGVIALLGFQILVNVGMTLGLAPVTGIPLPFLSLGGTSFVTSMVAVGILQNIHVHSRSG